LEPPVSTLKIERVQRCILNHGEEQVGSITNEKFELPFLAARKSSHPLSLEM
jgi:hypothetical protein